MSNKVVQCAALETGFLHLVIFPKQLSKYKRYTSWILRLIHRTHDLVATNILLS